MTRRARKSWNCSAPPASFPTKAENYKAIEEAAKNAGLLK